jgi:hypothetical protein
LDLVEALAHRPVTTTNASPSAIYRCIGANPEDPPTLLIDEADTIFGPKAGDNEDLRGLLNAGHQRNRPALRYNAASQSVEKIDTFALAALAGIGRMPDTIEDRAVIVRMRRRAPGETVAPYRHRRDRPHLDALRGDLHEWIRANLDELGDAAPAMPVEDRAADTWEPLIAVADLAGQAWPDLARAAVLALVDETTAEGDQSDTSRLLADIRAAFDATGATVLPTDSLLCHLRSDPEAPWADLGVGGLTAMRLGQMLREYGITSSNHRFPDRQAKGYARVDFADAWSRYLPGETTIDRADDFTGESRPSRPSRPGPGQPRDGSRIPAVPSRPGPDSRLILVPETHSQPGRADRDAEGTTGR